MLAVRSGGLETPGGARGTSSPGELLQRRHIHIHGRATAENKPCCGSASLGSSQMGGFLPRGVVPAL